MNALVQDPDPLVGKTQELRLVDIWLLGPAMMAVGLTGKIPTWMRPLAFLGGALTVWYNWRNYDRLKKARGMNP